MKPWRELTEHEKLDRLAHAVCLLATKIDALSENLGVGNIPGYEVLHVRPTPQAIDDYWGLYGGDVSLNG